MVMRALAVWMNGERVGTWRVGRTGHHVFEYDPTWRTNPKSRPLSLSLPLTADGRLEGEIVENYFDNLLPDNEAIRKRLMSRYKLRDVQAFTLLQTLGRDCVGAVQLLPLDTTTINVRTLEYSSLDLHQIDAVLGNLGMAGGQTGEEDEDFRISIAGAQEKTALLNFEGRWCRPRNATPTTHILKPPIGITPGRNLDLRLSPENEWLCSRLLNALGLPVAKSWVETFEHRRALVVERFDRQWQNTLEQGSAQRWLIRLPQEDFCQVLGRNAAQKYENDGGPGIQDCLQVLKGGLDYERDAGVFLLAQLAFWLLAAIDGHAKNFSLFLMPAGQYRLTPLYDVMSAWPILDRGAHSLSYKKVKMAMDLRGSKAHYKLGEILPRHWHAVVQRNGLSDLWGQMQALVNNVPEAIVQVSKELPQGFPTELAKAVFNGMQQHANRFNTQLALTPA
jgi:serine/threonine-protein kinase HipA